jgi:hypothetical protein
MIGPNFDGSIMITAIIAVVMSSVDQQPYRQENGQMTASGPLRSSATFTSVDG